MRRRGRGEIACALFGLTLACGDDGSSAANDTEMGSTTDVTTSSGTTTTGSTSTTSGGTTGSSTSGGDGSSTAAEEPSNCPRTAAAADRDRFVVVSKPYDADANMVTGYEVLALSATGELSTTGHTFDMGRSIVGHIGFTIDGELGVVAQDDGTLGVFRLDPQGDPTVVEAAFAGDFYAADIVMGADGERIFVLDTQTANNGGGIYEVVVDCDDVVHDVGVVLGGDLVYDVAYTPAGTPFVAARSLSIGGEAGADAFLLDGLDGPSVLGSADAFGDEDAIMAAAVVAAGGEIGIVADNSGYSGIPNRLAVVRLTEDSVTAVDVVPDLDDPYELVASPVDDTALMVSGFGDAIFILDVNAEAAEPVTIRGELAYVGTGPQLPAKAVMLERGALRGLVLVSENTGVRRVRFDGGGVVTDLGNFDLGDGVEHIVGSVGVQP